MRTRKLINYYGKSFVVATKHEKERVIAPLFKKNLGLNLISDTNIDTDQLGTFSGEVQRNLSPIDTLRIKCNMALEKSSATIAVASEGSFYAHPTIGFVPCDDELVMFLDKENNIEVIAREITTETNFSETKVTSMQELLNFSERVKFPSHGLILRQSETSTEGIVKGITKTSVLKKEAEKFLNKHGYAFVETDMRAHLNPTRMRVIKRTTEKLIEKLLHVCPACSTPGLDVKEVKSGLPCSACGLPTDSTLKFIYQCKSCQYSMDKLYPKGKSMEDPMYCNFCNP